MFTSGGDAYWIWQTGAQTPQGLVKIHGDQVALRADSPHLHDPISGGGIAYNAWHAAMIVSQYYSFGHQPFFRFTALMDNQGSFIEIPDGISQANPSIRAQTGVQENAKDAKNYISVWQFLYSKPKIAARWQGSGY